MQDQPSPSASASQRPGAPERAKEDEEVHAPANVIVGERLRSRRERRGWRQEDLAQRVRRDGVHGWTRVTVAAVERGDRSVSVTEQAALSGVFRRPWADFLALEEGEHLRLAGRLWLEHQVVVEVDAASVFRWGSLIESIRDGAPLYYGALGVGPTLDHAPDEADVKAARTLGITVMDLGRASSVLWERPLAMERDDRLGDVGDMTPRTLQARRGHVTRQLLEELREYLQDPKHPARNWYLNESGALVRGRHQRPKESP